jgi:hypothetical protein
MLNKYLHLLPNGFSFSTTSLLAFLKEKTKKKKPSFTYVLGRSIVQMYSRLLRSLLIPILDLTLLSLRVSL